jgi:hypothetical protein
MRLGLRGKPRLWSVLVLTVVAAIALVAGISSQTLRETIADVIASGSVSAVSADDKHYAI